MSRMINAAIPVTLFLSALALSSCASKPEPAPVAEPATTVAAVEKPAVPEAAPEPAAAPVAVAEPPAASPEPVPKPVIKKSKKIAVKRAPPPAPVMIPAPVVEQPAPAAIPPEPSHPVKIAPPAEKISEPGFLEKYWLWLLGLAIVIAGVFAWLWRSQEGKH